MLTLLFISAVAVFHKYTTRMSVSILLLLRGHMSIYQDIWDLTGELNLELA